MLLDTNANYCYTLIRQVNTQTLPSTLRCAEGGGTHAEEEIL